MRVLLISPYAPPASRGGMESQLEALSSALPGRGHGVVVVAPPLPPGLPELGAWTDPEGPRVHRTPLVDPDRDAENPGDDEEIADWFRRLLDRESVDRVIAHNLHLWVHPTVGDALCTTATERNVPVYLRVHNFCADDEVDRLHAQPWHRYLCVSECLSRSLAAQGVAEERLEVVYPPIDTELFRPAPSRRLRRELGIPEDAVVVLYSGRLVGGYDTYGQKGLPDSLELFARVTTPDCRLVFCVARPGPDLEPRWTQGVERLRAEARKLGVEGRVHVTSASYEEMPEVYNDAQIVAVFSRLETFGRAYAEASACGLPVVGTPVGGVPEVVVHGETGYLVDRRDDAVETLDALASDEELRRRLGHAGRRRVVERFSVPAVMDRLEHVLGANR